jgi:hypothetical protein
MAPRREDDYQERFTSICLTLVCGAACRGIVIVNTPFLKVAATPSWSASSGSDKTL